MTPLSAEDVADRYRAAGLVVREFDDEAGHVYRAHRHERTYLFGLDGVGLMKLGEGDAAAFHLVTPGTELVVEAGVLHGGVAGPDGWNYLAAQPSD